MGPCPVPSHQVARFFARYAVAEIRTHDLPLAPESKLFPISMAQTGGEIAAKRPKPSDDGDGDGIGEDRLSALPDDVLVLILLRLDGVAAAARTSILSRRWRRVWALLPELRFDLVPDGHRIREIHDAPEAPELRSISITTEGAGPDSASAWLPVAARRLIGGLAYSNMVPGNDDEEEVVEEGEAGARGEVQLPCFEKDTVIVLDLGLLGLALPSAGVFARITKLYLSRVWFRGPCDLGNVRLKVSESRGVRNLSIHSESFLRIKLENLHLLRQLTIVAPKLPKLCMDFNFIDDDPTEPVANISAPQLQQQQGQGGVIAGEGDDVNGSPGVAAAGRWRTSPVCLSSATITTTAAPAASEDDEEELRQLPTVVQLASTCH
nr:unnamed protein product [Digitaria exilis]